MSQLSDIRAIFAEHLLLNTTGNNATFFADFGNEVYYSGKSEDVIGEDAIAWENCPLEPVPDIWVRFTFFQDTIGQAEFGTYGRNNRTGTLQLSVFAPIHGGIGPALERASAIEKTFPRDFSGKRNGIHARVIRTEVEHHMSDDIYFHIPVSVYWLAYTPPL